MKSGHKTLHWDSPMPATTSREHFDSSGIGNTVIALRKCEGRPLGADGIITIDMNFQVAGDHAWSIHWGNAVQNGFTYVYDQIKKGVRKMTPVERNMSLRAWGNRVKDWRLTSANDNQRPITLSYAYKVAAEIGVVIIAELKSILFATEKWAQYVLRCAKKNDHPAWVMALMKMPKCREKCEYMEAEKVQFALIGGDFKQWPASQRTPPKDWKQWKHHPTRNWISSKQGDWSVAA